MRRKQARKSYRLPLLILLLLACAYVFIPKEPSIHKTAFSPTSNPKPSTTAQTHTPYTGSLGAALFIPYWNIPSTEPSLPNIDSQPDTLIYFGVTPNGSTLDTTEPGFLNLTTFVNMPKDSFSSTLLTLRMLNEAENTEVLRDLQAQNELISETIDLANQHAFTGIVLDLEHSVLPTKETTDQITSFIKRFALTAHSNSLTFAVTLYGDTYYRFRPYDVPVLADHIDRAYLMAYDFHKSLGEPGPNFPLKQGETYSYSFEKMLEDFSQDIPPEKITVLFGLYGYDWSVDDQNRPAKAATARPLTQIQARFLPNCPFSACSIFRDPVSAETRITYTDDTKQKHTMWYEDLSSIETKIDLARLFGIRSVGYWTYGYY